MLKPKVAGSEKCRREVTLLKLLTKLMWQIIIVGVYLIFNLFRE
jgi:hypothetical protein